MQGFGDKRQPCLPFLWRSVLKADFAGFCSCSTIEANPAIIIYSAPLEIPTSQGLLGYSPYGNRKEKSIVAGSVLTFVLLTNTYWKCLDRKMGTICMHNSLLTGSYSLEEDGGIGHSHGAN